MLKVEANRQKNVLYVTVEGHFTLADTTEASERVISEAGQLLAGYTIISDFRRCLPTSEECLRELHHLMEFLSAHGMKRVIRITQIPLTAIQMERVSRQVGYVPITVFTLEEAEKILATRVQQSTEADLRNWESVRKYKRVAVGPDHRIKFTVGDLEFPSIRITNLSGQGCFAVTERHWGDLIHEGTILVNFTLEHPDLPQTPIAAKVVRLVKCLTEISEDDTGLGIQFLSPSTRYVEWVDAYVSAYYNVDA